MATSYICYDSNGLLISRIVFDHDPPVGYDAEQASPTHPLAIEQRNFHMSQTDAQGIYKLDCADPYVAGQFCSCASDAQKDKIFDGISALTDKPALVIKIDGGIIDFGTHSRTNPIDITAGNTCVLRAEVVCPDSTSVPLLEDAPSLFPSATSLVFTSNAAETTLTAPPAGYASCIGVKTNMYVKPFCVYIRGI